jgi:hypothetical protein
MGLRSSGKPTLPQNAAKSGRRRSVTGTVGVGVSAW